MTETCGACRYFKPADRLGYCLRYPIPARKGPGEWCGEFAQAEAAPAADNVVPLGAPKKATRKRKGRA